MMLGHVKHRAIAQQVDLEVGDLALGFYPEGKFFHGPDVGAIRPGLEGAPVPTGTQPVPSPLN